MTEQLSIDFTIAREEGERLSELCVDKAERVAEFDRKRCADFIAGWLMRHGPLPGEVCTDAAKAHGFHPHDDRAFGAVYQSLVRANRIRFAGFCARTKGHGTAGGRIWQAVL